MNNTKLHDIVPFVLGGDSLHNVDKHHKQKRYVRGPIGTGIWRDHN